MANISILLIVLLLKVFSPAEQRCPRTLHFIKNVNQTDARAACREIYTDLVTVNNKEENDALINLINTLLPANSRVWIGLQRNNNCSKWSNGDNVTFSALTGSCGTMPCCAVMKTDGSWDNITCTETRNFMCYKQDQTEHNSSYHLITEKMTWYEAQSYCRKNYTDLVSIENQTQSEEVRKAGMNSSTPFWIGLLYDEWEWADGGRSAYRNWLTGSPQIIPGRNCVYLEAGKWETISCNSTAPGTLCYKEMSRTEQSPKRTFHLFTKNLTQFVTQAACRGNNLVTIYDEKQNSELTNLTTTLLPAGSRVWIGLQRKQNSYKWSNGDEVTFKTLTGSCGPKPCCAAMKTDGSCESLQCTETRNFMCYKPVNQTLLSYHLITDQSLNWSEAQRYCRKNYTDLLSIRDQEPNEAVKKAGIKSNDSFWIDRLLDNWEWADGECTDYRNWETGQPRSSSDCTQLRNGKWQTVPCTNVVEAIMCYT